MTCDYFKGEEVSLYQILERREQRALIQEELLSKAGTSLICLTLNIAGSIKTFPMAKLSFEEGCSRIDAFFISSRRAVAERVIKYQAEGYEGFWAVDADPLFLKKQMAAIEEQDSLSRFFDIDVLSKEGRKISRTEIRLPERKCFLCPEPAAVCSRSQKHGSSEIFKYITDTMYNYFLNHRAEVIASLAVKSLTYEVAVSPKPGLVDRFDSGAHRDMDFFTFIDSGSSLYPYFRACAQIGMETYDLDGDTVAAKLRVYGMQAEQIMYHATNGVNTHKGAIFSVGIMCAAAGRVLAGHIAHSNDMLFGECRMLAQSYLDDFSPGSEQTAGEFIYLNYGIAGIRGEAAAGFPAVQKYGLPVLIHCIENKKMNINAAGMTTLLHLICNTQDTTLIKRCGKDGAESIQNHIRTLLGQEDLDPAQISALNEVWSDKGISAGGCADLLAVCFFVYFLPLCINR